MKCKNDSFILCCCLLYREKIKWCFWLFEEQRKHIFSEWWFTLFLNGMICLLFGSESFEGYFIWIGLLLLMSMHLKLTFCNREKCFVELKLTEWVWMSPGWIWRGKIQYGVGFTPVCCYIFCLFMQWTMRARWYLDWR